jgi:hypothetical protein
MGKAHGAACDALFLPSFPFLSFPFPSLPPFPSFLFTSPFSLPPPLERLPLPTPPHRVCGLSAYLVPDPRLSLGYSHKHISP